MNKARNFLSFLSPIRSNNSLRKVSHQRSEFLNFEDYRNVFVYKSNWDLVRALSVLKICSYNVLVDNSLQMMAAGQKVLGKKLFSGIMKPTFYNQFVGGETESELQRTVENLKMSGLRLMVCPVQEEDVGEAKTEGGEDPELKYESNKSYIMNVGRIMSESGTKRPNLQCKITAFISADVVKKLADICTTDKSLEDTAHTLSLGFTNDDSNNNNNNNNNNNKNNISIKGLDPSENIHLSKGMRRLNELCDLAVSSGLRILVDGEYTYMNRGISAITLAMVFRCNKESPVVGNTYQCYLKEAMSNVLRERSIILRRDLCFGAKIVRGAYMEKERLLARTHGYPDPINDSYEATGAMYDGVVTHLLDQIKKEQNSSKSKKRKKTYLVIASHNEDSIRHAVDRIRDYGLDVTEGDLAFGQIYGMAEQISVPLARAGFTVYKSVPFGPLSEVLPYLSRRAAENRVVVGGARKEQQLLRAELRRRMGGKRRNDNDQA